MSRSRVRRYQAPAATFHGVEEAAFREAVEYLGGAFVETDDGGRVLQWSPRTAKRLGQQARQAFGGWHTVPVSLVTDVLEAFHTVEREYRLRWPCRPCATRGVEQAATHELFGVLALCDDHAATYRPVVPAPPKRVPLKDRFCRNCYRQVFHGPHVQQQLDLLGRFANLCGDCWTRRSVRHEELIAD